MAGTAAEPEEDDAGLLPERAAPPASRSRSKSGQRQAPDPEHSRLHEAAPRDSRTIAGRAAKTRNIRETPKSIIRWMN